MAVVRSSDDDNAIRYVLPVLWMTSCLPIIDEAKSTLIWRIIKVVHQEAKYDVYTRTSSLKASVSTIRLIISEKILSRLPITKD